MDAIINRDWEVHLNPIFKQQYFQNILQFLDYESHKKTIYPPKKIWFKAFELTSFKNTKIVIIGQDPYHNEGQAHGISFSVLNGKATPSLTNIYKELATDLSVAISTNTNLSAWAMQGVLLLNSILTVEKNLPQSHAKIGWDMFTDAVINILNTKKNNIVFMLWGNYAKKKQNLIDQNKHLVLKAPHPSPLSAHNGFFGCKHFSKANTYLKKTGQQTIKWQL